MASYQNIILFILDTVRSDRFSLVSKQGDNTPNLSYQKEKFFLFENVISPATWTVPSHASIFTGLYSNQHKLSQVNSSLNTDICTIAQTLSNQGYSNTLFTQNPIVGFSKNRLNSGFSNYFFNNKVSKFSTSGELSLADKIASLIKRKLTPTKLSTFSQAEAILDSIIKLIGSPINQKNFIVVNLMLAHPPYSTDNRSLNITKLNKHAVKKYSDMHLDPTYWTSTSLSNLDVENLQNIYNKQIFLLDYLLGNFFNILGISGKENETAVIITSDHGDNLGENQILNHVFDFSDYLLHVPLAIFAPKHGGNKNIVDRVSNRRIFHTILDMAGLSDNLSLIRKNINIEPYVFAQYVPIDWGLSRITQEQRIEISKLSLDQEKVIVYFNEYKLITDFASEPILYNLIKDPTENYNCFADNSLIGGEMLSQAENFAGLQKKEHAFENIIDDEYIFEHLKQLGYLS